MAVVAAGVAAAVAAGVAVNWPLAGERSRKGHTMTEVVYTPLHPTVQTLSNGLRVVSEYLPYVHSASLGVWIKTGSGNETAGQAGISHFLEHLLFKGTETRTSRELMDAIESRGGQMNAFTTREYTSLYARVLDQHVPKALEILADIIRHSTFCDLEKERNVILEEIASANDVPEELIHDLLTESAWPDHPLGRPIAGYERTVAVTGLDDVRAYHGQWYTPENMIVAIVGRFDEDVFLRQVEEAFGVLPARPVPELAGPPVYAAGQRLEARSIAQDHLMWSFPSVPITHDDRYAYDVLSSALGGGSTSRLFERIREQEGLAYAVYAFNSMYASGGLLGFYAAIAPENLQRSLDLCAEELRRLKEERLPAEELASNREQLKGGLMLALESTFNRMTRMVRSLFAYGRIVPVDEILESVDGVTAEDVQRVARRIFTEENSRVAVLGPVTGSQVALRVD